MHHEVLSDCRRIERQPPIRLALDDDALPMISGALNKPRAECRANKALGQATSSPT
jgi:hypothetical protein